MKIPFARAPLEYADAEPYLREAIDNGWLTTGPLTERFTASLKEYLGTENLIPVSSCTAALQIALAAADLPKDAEVILPSNTFVATFETVELQGLVPVLADIDAETWNISLAAIEKQITAKTRAIIAVPFAGCPLPMRELRHLADRYELTLILDSAHALETCYDGRRLHEYADYTAFSFYATKNLTTAEGGALVAPAEKMERVRALSLHGMSRAAWNRYAGGSWRYDIMETGFKANLTDIHAALGLAQIGRLKEYAARRIAIARAYRNGLAGLPIRMQALPPNASDSDHAWHLFCISLTPEAKVTREQVMEIFREKSIGFSVHFIPIYEFTTAKKYPRLTATDFPANANYFQGALSLPIYPTLSDEAVAEIIRTLRLPFADGAAMSGR